MEISRSKFEQPEDHRLIALTREYFVKVDVEDFEWLSQWTWSAKVLRQGQIVYAQRNAGNGVWELMHRLILGNPKSQVDHKDRDGLNNRRSNLRVATISQQNQNKGLRRDNSTGYIGVSRDWRKTSKSFISIIHVEGKSLRKAFATAEEAARHRDELAAKHFGSFATFNFPRT